MPCTYSLPCFVETTSGVVISQFWASLIVKHLRLFQWVFALRMRALSSHYTRLCLIVNENNVILFSFINPKRLSFLT